MPHAEASDEVAFEVEAGIGRIRLTRPRAINSLTTAMCRAIRERLAAWADDAAVERVEITGEGPKGLCAGGDVVAVRQAIIDGEPRRGFDFFEVEFAMDRDLAHYPKPVTAHQRGIVMGGGLGISAHVGLRLAYADTRSAMPETIIGYFPDVGMRWLLGKAPGELGTHLALTGSTINAADSIMVGFSDEMAPGEAAPDPTLAVEEWQRCYEGSDAAAIIARLEAHEHPAARQAAAEIRKRSPLSVWMSLEGLRRAQRATSVDEVLAEDLVLARHTLSNPDFVEGVRAQLVDKDRRPRWRHARIEDVPRADVEAMFAG